MASPPQCSYEGCPEAAWSDDPNGLCLYHSPENGKSDSTARAVWARARSKAEACDPSFQGWHFPDDPCGQGLLRLFADPRTLDVRLDRATFCGRAWLCVVTGRLVCRETVFTGEVFCPGVSFSSAVFEGAHFHGSAQFASATFAEGATFDGAVFHADAHFGGAKFVYTASFERAIFEGSAVFAQSRFENWASWRSAQFGGTAQFGLARFENNANFAGAQFKGMVSFHGASVQQGKDILFDVPPEAAPFSGPDQGETAYRLAEEAARARGDHHRAGQYHYAEQCAVEHENRRRHGRNFWRWLPGLVFGRWVFGFGERPRRVLLAGLVVILFFGMLFWSVSGIAPNGDEATAYSPDLAECLYFSIVTFTTLGYGDFAPKPNFRLLAGIEALLGAALIAVFIVGLARKYMR
ncbi:pentapeptide repeat-containing protein [Planctomycetota bacterium]